jgi:hypothetical protein
MNMRRIVVFSFIILFTVFSGCRRNLHPVPDIPFNINVNVNLPSYSGLQSIGGYAYVDNVGVKGLVIYRRSMDEFVAFDRMSTAIGGDTCAPIYVDPNNLLILLDPCTESKFSLFDGSLIQGPAEWGLRGYRTIWNGANILNVQN